MLKGLLSESGFVILCVIWFAACKVDNGKEQVVSIEPEFSLDLWEDLSKTPNLTFRIKSIDLQDCTNYGIDASAGSSGNFLTLIINNIVAPENCTPGSATAQTQVALTPLPDGSYDFQVILKDAIFNSGALYISPTSYNLELFTTNGVVQVRSELLRIPSQTIWGFVGYENKSAGQPHALQFIDELKTLTAPVQLTDGYYGYFKATSQGISLIPSPPFTNFQTFAFKLTSTREELMNLLDNFRSGPANGVVTVSLSTWDGEHL